MASMAKLDRRRLRDEIHALYRADHAELGAAGTAELLEQGRQWDLAPVLAARGVVVFPHARVRDCGHQIAAAVHACLDSGADRVLVLSVLHAASDELEEARVRVAAGEDPARFPIWGIQGPGLPGREEWRQDHALMSFRHFFASEVQRRGARGPEVIERYPYLAGGHPDRLPGIEEVARLAEEAVVIATTDPFHHGLGYGDGPEQSLSPEAGGRELARRTIEEGIAILEGGDYPEYNAHCVVAKSDGRDVGQVFRFLRGPLRGRILDLVTSDTSAIYHQPAPTWVAGALVAWQPGGAPNSPDRPERAALE